MSIYPLFVIFTIDQRKGRLSKDVIAKMAEGHIVTEKESTPIEIELRTLTEFCTSCIFEKITLILFC